MQNLFHLRTKVEVERRRRIMLAVWAYAYEIADPPQSLVSDHHFDAECLKVDRSIKTGHPVLDAFFALDDLGGFQTHTGQWIYHHPELEKVAKTYRRFYDTCDGRYGNIRY